MGYSVALISIVVFSTFAFAFVILSQSVSNSITHLDNAIVDRSNYLNEKYRVFYSVLNLSYLSPNLYINISNNGSVAINVLSLDLIIDGQLRTQNISYFAINDVPGLTLWAPADVLTIVVDDVQTNPIHIFLTDYYGTQLYIR